MARHYWLVKSEPVKYSWDRFVKDGRTLWDGVRNFEARNNLRAMRVADRVLFYHSNEGKAVVGIAEVKKEAFPDPTAKDGDWSVVELVPIQPLLRPVLLSTIKADAVLADIALLRRSRLSVVALSAAHFQRILKLGNTKVD